MRRLMTIVALSAGLLVVAAIVGAIVRDGPSEHLSRPEYTAMARSIGALGGGGSIDALCGHLTDDAGQRLQLLDLDCRVSKRMADLKDAIAVCGDVACVRPLATELVARAREAEVIERRFGADLRGDCQRFFAIEADYDAAIADAADHLRTLPSDAWFMDGLTQFRDADSAAELAVDRQPVLLLLSACEPGA